MAAPTRRCCSVRGHLCEAPGHNVFVLHGRRLRTPAHDILEGITQATVMDRARDAGLEVDALTSSSTTLTRATG